MGPSPDSWPDEAAWAYARAAAAYQRLPIPEECWAGVIANLRTLREHAALVMDFPLGPEIQADSAFRP
jgi:hypothetical protein